MDFEPTTTCPFCGCEFEVGASACPSCDLPLFTGEPAHVGAVATSVAPRREFAVGELRCVTVAANQAEAEMLEGLLRSEGIPCIVRRSFGSDVPDFLAAGRRDILVPEGGLAAARDLLRLSAELPVAAKQSPVGLALAVIFGLIMIAAGVAAIMLLG